MGFINRWALTAWAKPWVPFRLSREHDGSSGSQVPSHRRFNGRRNRCSWCYRRHKGPWEQADKNVAADVPRQIAWRFPYTAISPSTSIASTPPFRSRDDLAPPLAAPAKHLPALVPRDLLPFHRCVPDTVPQTPLRFLCALISALQRNHAIRAIYDFAT